MTTVNDLVNSALKKSGVLGVGQTASPEDSNDAFNEINYMLAQWNRKRWIVPHLVDTSINSTGAESYTVGTGGDFNIARPDRLEFAYFRLLNTTGQNEVDYPVEILEAREDYARIALKSLVTWPSYVFYDSAYPLGSVFFWPIPQANLYELHILTKAVLESFTSLSQSFNLAPEYEAAIIYNLAARLRPNYQLPPEPSITALATDSLNVLRNANAQVPRLRIPRQLVRGSLYNIFADRTY